MSSDTANDTATASKQGTEGSTVGSGVGYSSASESGDLNIKGTGDGADTKGEVLSAPKGDSSTSREEGDPESVGEEHEATTYRPRGPPNGPSHGRPPIKR